MKNRTYFFAFLLLDIFLFLDSYYRNIGVTKTVGWAFDIRGLSYMTTLLNTTIATISYLLFALFKARISAIVTRLHLVILVFLAVLDFFYWYDAIFLLNLLPTILLLANIVVAIRNRIMPK